MKLEETQKAICEKFKAEYVEAGLGTKIWVARNVLEEDIAPINGARQINSLEESGWYIWGGTETFDDPDFFVTVDVADMDEWCAYVLPYLGLAPGWRFIIAEDHEQVFFDERLLN